MKSAIFPGTFDPPTLGHWDIIQRAAQLFDKLYIVVAANTSKGTACFLPSERKELLEILTMPLTHVEVIIWSGLIVDLANELRVKTLVRGIRTAVDFEMESSYAQMNKSMTGIETILLVTDERYRSIQSSLVREIGAQGRRLTLFVPSVIEELIHRKLASSQCR